MRALLPLLASLLTVVAQGRPEAAPGQPAVVPSLAPAVAGADRTWRACGEPPAPELSSRSLLAAALTYCEAGVFAERLPRLVELAAAMQDRDAASPSYGNFRWYWRDDKVGDRNAVDFTMQAGAVLWLRHRDGLAPPLREQVRQLLQYGLEGSLRHAVSEDYTNIALMNAANLILLGEGLDQPAASQEGQERLTEALAYTCASGTHEYVSPTYYDVDLVDLGLLEAFTRSETARQQARALLELLWTDVALNWYPPAQKLAGAQSRTYSYVQGLGSLDNSLMAAGWLPWPARGGPDVLAALTRWRPAPALRELSEQRFPRLVQQCFGPSRDQSRTHYLQRDVTLSSAGASYGGWMDMPLTVDLPGDRNRPRCYFIADGRRDPYGKAKVAAGIHAKAFHLSPFWAANQRRSDAVALAVYTPRSLQGATEVVESNLVLPRDVAGLYGPQGRLSLPGEPGLVSALQPGEALVLRQGTAAVGVRVLAARDLAGGPATLALVDDGAATRCVRLVVSHQVPGRALPPTASAEGPSFSRPAFVALWLRVGSNLADDAAFERWRQGFASAAGQAQVADGELKLQVAALDGPLGLSAAAPWVASSSLLPEPPRVVLALDGDDLGKRILEPVRPPRPRLEDLPRAQLAAGKPLELVPERALLQRFMQVGKDPTAGSFVWMPGEVGGAGGGARGSATWCLDVRQAGRYYLSGCVLTPTPSDDSFFVSVFTGRSELLPQSYWPVGTHTQWEWTPVVLEGGRQPLALDLPAGVVYLQVRVREDGAKLARLRLSAGGEGGER